MPFTTDEYKTFEATEVNTENGSTITFVAPDQIVDSGSVVNTETGSTITFTAPDTITDSANGFTGFVIGHTFTIAGSESGDNDGVFTVLTRTDGEITTVEQTIVTNAVASGTVVATVHDVGFPNFLAGDKISVAGSPDGTNDGIFTVATSAIGQLDLVEQTIIDKATPSTTTVITQLGWWDQVGANEKRHEKSKTRMYLAANRAGDTPQTKFVALAEADDQIDTKTRIKVNSNTVHTAATS